MFGKGTSAEAEIHIKHVLEEYDREKSRGLDGLESFKRLLESKEFIQLLPGTVPGFALRKRRWGETWPPLSFPRLAAD